MGSTGLGDEIVQRLAELSLGRCSHGHMRVALHRSKDQCRHTAHPEEGSKFLLVVHIHLVNIYFPCILTGKLIEHRRERLARSAPRSIEVDECRAFAQEFPLIRISQIVSHFSQESSFGQIYRSHIFFYRLYRVMQIISFSLMQR